MDFVGAIAGIAKSVVEPVAHAVTAVVHGAGEAAHAGIEAVHAGAKLVTKAGHAVAKAVGNGVETARKGAGAIGRWAWENKAEIGLWVGSAALLAAIPVTGGASGALAGGLLAGRVGLVAARVASAGRIGATAVRAARTGVSLLRSARTAATGTRAGAGAARVVARAGSGLHTRRIALGGTTAGRAMIAARVPLGIAGTSIAAVNLVDHGHQATKGKGSIGQIALDVLGLIPSAGLLVRSIASRRAAASVANAVESVSERAPAVEGVARRALDNVDELADSARVIDPSAVRQQVGATARTAERVLDDGSLAVSGSDELRDVGARLDAVARSARAAREQLQVARIADPALTRAPVADAVAGDLTSLTDLAEGSRDVVARAVVRTVQLEQQAVRAQRVGAIAGDASTGTRLVANTNRLADGRSRDGEDLTRFSIGSTLLGLFLRRNARVHAG